MSFPLTPTLPFDVYSSRLSVVAHILYSITFTYHPSSFFSCCHWVYLQLLLFSHSSLWYLFSLYPPPIFAPLYFFALNNKKQPTNKTNTAYSQASTFLGDSRQIRKGSWRAGTQQVPTPQWQTGQVANRDALGLSPCRTYWLGS